MPVEVRIDGGTLEGVSKFVYFGVETKKTGGCREEVENCVAQ